MRFVTRRLGWIVGEFDRTGGGCPVRGSRAVRRLPARVMLAPRGAPAGAIGAARGGASRPSSGSGGGFGTRAEGRSSVGRLQRSRFVTPRELGLTTWGP